MLTNIQKQIYNTHLSTSRSHQKKPYTVRKDFENFETEKPAEYVNICKIEQIINSCNITLKTYFNAPYILYKDTDYFDLQFYTTQKAIKCYTIYLNQFKSGLPDNPDQLDFIKDSLIFLKDYCIEKNIVLLDYFKQEFGLSPAWAVHLAESKTSMYLIIGFELFGCKIQEMMYNMHPDDQDMYLGNISELYPRYIRNIHESKTAKKLIVEGVKKIDKIINEKRT